MRILLINPNYPISETPSPPLGISYLAAVLEAAGAEVQVLDFVVYPYDPVTLEKEIIRFDPQIAGITCVTMTFPEAVEIVRDLKHIAPGIVTVLGGPHVSFTAQTTLARVPEIDCIVQGEGEGAVVALARAVAGRTGLDAVPGLVWRKGSRIVDNGPAAAPVDLNALPIPDRSRIPLGRYRALGLPVSMTTSRGCPFSCIFCVGRKMVGPRVRYHDPVRVVDEMQTLGRLGFSQINLADDLFTANTGHCLGVCREIRNRELSLQWTSFARVDTVTDKLLAALRSAGCHTLSFGAESANAGILKTVRKGITSEQVTRAVSCCAEAGIMPQVSFILGLPGETPQTLDETLAFADRLKQMGAACGFHLLAPFPGTEVRQRAGALGLRILTDDWRRYHANRAVVETETVSAATLDRIVIAWEEKFDAYLGEIGRLRETGRAAPEESWPLTRLEHTIVIHDLMMARVMEQKGTWQNGQGPVDPAAALTELAGRIPIPSSASYDRTQLDRTLDFALAEGYLDLAVDAGTIRWRWVDYLPT